MRNNFFILVNQQRYLRKSQLHSTNFYIKNLHISRSICFKIQELFRKTQTNERLVLFLINQCILYSFFAYFDKLCFTTSFIFILTFSSEKSDILYSCIINLGIFITGIGDFFKSGDFYPGDGGFFEIWEFSSRGSGIFIPGDWGFF